MLKQWLGALIIAPTVAGLVIAANAVGLFQMLEWATIDQYFRLRPREPIDPRIAIVTINESDIQKIGKWPIPDGVLAQVVNNLKKHRPKAIGLDLYRDLPVPPGSEQLIQAFKSTPNLIGVEKKVGDTVAPSPILQKLGQVALADLVLDADGKVRRGLMSIKADDGQTRLSLSAHLSLMYLESKGVTLQRINTSSPGKNKGVSKLGLGKAVFVPFTGNDGGYVGANSGGYQVLLNFRGSLDSFSSVSLADVLENRIGKQIEGKIVLIGATGQSLNDLFLTPYSSNIFSSPQRTPGVVIHANLVSQTLSAALDGRPLIQVWPEFLEWLWIFFWSGCGATLGLIFAHKRWTVISMILLGGTLLGISYLTFLNGWWIPVVAPMLALIGSSAGNTGYILVTNLRLYHKKIEDYSRHLEEKVKERTRELEKQKDYLEIQAIELAQMKETAIAASVAKSSFLANMSHELRTPLNAILGFTQLMSHDTSLSEENQEYIEIINSSGAHLLGLINDVLEMSKIEAGRIELRESDFNLYRLLENLKEMLRLKAEEKGLLLIVEIVPNVPQYIKTDEKKLRQILINLLGNGIKFTQSGYVKLVVQIDCSSKNYKLEHQKNGRGNPCIRLRFAVEDTGAGIAEKELHLLFETFAQTETGRQSGQGTGLGLAISRKLVQLMGGDISINSTLGKGTTFSFDIQVTLTDTSEDLILQASQRPIALETGQPDYRILVVDEVKETRQLMVRLLTPVGFQVGEAINGEDALALSENWQPHLILIDMPTSEIDEYEVIQRIKAQDQFTTIVALTTHTFADERARLLSIGCDDFVGKPFQEQEIFAIMSQHLGVRYLYEIQEEKNPHKGFSDIAIDPTQPAPLSNSLSSSELEEMPLDWYKELNYASSQGDDILIYQLIEQIPSSNSALANRLTELNYNFYFQQILELTETKISHIQGKLSAEIEYNPHIEVQLESRKKDNNNLYIGKNNSSFTSPCFVNREETLGESSQSYLTNVDYKAIEPEPTKDGLTKILVVDDIAENLRLLSGILIQKGYQVEAVLDGITALTVAETNHPDLILLDINMPKMDGYQVCKKLKQNIKTNQIPVIFISAMNETMDKVKAFKVGGADYISKPFQMEEVLARVENHLTINSLQKQLVFQNKNLQKEIKNRILAEESLRLSESKEREKSQELAQAIQQLTQAQAKLVQQEKMSSLGQLVAGIAHEINNPVNFIHANLDHLYSYNQDLLNLLKLYQNYFQDIPIPEEISTNIENIDCNFLVEDLTKILNSMKVGTQRIVEIVKSLRTFSRLDEAEVKSVDIHEGINSTLMILDHRLKSQSDKSSSIDVIKEYGNLPIVECYAGQLNQVFMNIIANGIDALEDRKRRKDSENWQPQIRIRTEVLNEEKVVIYITDNGVGMTDEVRRRLFDPFFTTKDVGKGTGLGMSISYQIAVDKHGGEIRCISAPGQGTMFAIELPIKQTDTQ